MKLIIDIPEDRYKDVIEAQKHHLLDSYAHAVANGIPLEQIRQEIEELDKYYDNDYFSVNNCPMFKCNEVLLIIDKYKEDKE